MPDIDVTFRNENNGKEVEVTVSDDMPADAILRNLAEAGLIPNTPGTALVYRGMQLRPRCREHILKYTRRIVDAAIFSLRYKLWQHQKTLGGLA
ncbi:MAG: hypothetical protein FD167_2062 [bacterium]|nr:MAG: hypothetical protein FD167_2062 [bacterium]